MKHDMRILRTHAMAVIGLLVLLFLIFFFWRVSVFDLNARLIAGILVCIIFFVLVYSIVTSRSKTLQLADEMTKQLKQNQEILQTRDRAMNSTVEGILITDASSLDNPIIYVNKGFERLTGYDSKEVIGRNCKFLQGNDKNQPALAEIRKSILAKSECKAVLRNYRKDGTLFWNELSISPVFDGGRLTNFVGILHDITELKKKEEELSQKRDDLEKSKAATLNIMEDIEFVNKDLTVAQEQLKQSLAELKKLDYQKDQFISIAAHELKTPLTSIKGFSDLLRKKEVVENQPLRERYLGIINSDTKRLATLITNILELSRMDLGTMKLAMQKIKISELVNEVKDQMDIIIKSKGLESRYIIEEGMNLIWADKDKLIQVISNLINNAVHYTEKGSISVDIKQQKDDVLFSVSDTGIGIPKEHIGKLFTRFYQVDNPLTRKMGGSGLGLSISKGFVESMGGKIWVESEVDKGTTFYFTIPLEKTNSKEVQIVKK